jgi:hypothetical protein
MTLYIFVRRHIYWSALKARLLRVFHSMTYLTFIPTKSSRAISKLVKCLGIAADAFLLLLMMWNIANICYPFWGWMNYAFIWIGCSVVDQSAIFKEKYCSFDAMIRWKDLEL